MRPFRGNAPVSRGLWSRKMCTQTLSQICISEINWFFVYTGLMFAARYSILLLYDDCTWVLVLCVLSINDFWYTFFSKLQTPFLLWRTNTLE